MEVYSKKTLLPPEMGLLHTKKNWTYMVFKAEFSGLSEMGRTGSPIPASHLKTDFLWAVGHMDLQRRDPDEESL